VPSIPLAPAVGVAVLAVAAWFGLLAVLALATRTPSTRPGPATGALGPESPALVDLLTGGWQLCDEAASAALLDLAARRVVTIEEVGPELSLVRLGRGPVPPLAPYEQLVLDHVRRLATADRVVATGALAEGARNLGSWWRSFTRAVIVEARAAGLSEPRWTAAHRTVLAGAGAVPAVVVGACLAGYLPRDEGDDPFGTFAIGAVLVFALLNGLVQRMSGERGTAAGAAAAGRWLGVREHLRTGRFAEAPAAAVTIWGRPLAYAAVLGLAGRAVVSLPVSIPADDSRAWSAQGGMWHVVRVDYRGPGPWGRFFWGQAPWPAVGRALIATIPSFGIAFVLGILGRALLGLPTEPEPVGLLGAALVAGVPLVGAVLDLATRHTVEGQVVRLRRYVKSSSDDSTTYHYFVALDDGRSRSVHAYGVDAERWARLSEGDIVRATVGRRLGWVHDVEILEPVRRR
jgi:hypothetical protein